MQEPALLVDCNTGGLRSTVGSSFRTQVFCARVLLRVLNPTSPAGCCSSCIVGQSVAAGGRGCRGACQGQVLQGQDPVQKLHCSRPGQVPKAKRVFSCGQNSCGKPGGARSVSYSSMSQCTEFLSILFLSILTILTYTANRQG